MAAARHGQALGSAARAIAHDEDGQGARVDRLGRHEAGREGAAPHEREGRRAQVLRKLAEGHLPRRVVDPVGVDLDPPAEHLIVGDDGVDRLARTERDRLLLVRGAGAVLDRAREVRARLVRARAVAQVGEVLAERVVAVKDRDRHDVLRGPGGCGLRADAPPLPRLQGRVPCGQLQVGQARVEDGQVRVEQLELGLELLRVVLELLRAALLKHHEVLPVPVELRPEVEEHAQRRHLAFACVALNDHIEVQGNEKCGRRLVRLLPLIRVVLHQ